ncbi:MAG TPA: acyl-CoA dehydrogenase family protein [Rhizomicrobium sp.]|nr:acyl-CoA dehydrogenase family protein [Rhizomicrobium sp.]
MFWAQGYSEIGSGSDLASLATRGMRDGDEYVIDGHKIWTTQAHWADWIFCLVRTSNEQRKQEGISIVCVPMNSPGIAVHPIIGIDGSHHLNKVTFDNVRVPVAYRIGEEGRGWSLAKFVLNNERLSYAHIARKRVDVKLLKMLQRKYSAGGMTTASLKKLRHMK